MSKTKNKILSAAIKVFSKSPAASMENIAESVNLNRRTLHRYFSSKSELIKEIIDYASFLCLQKTIEAIQSSTDPVEQLKTMFLSDIESGYQFRFLYHYKDGYKGMESESSNFKQMMKLFKDLLKTLQKNQNFNSELSIDWIESFYFSTIDAAINLIEDDELNMQKINEMAWTSYSKAIITKSN